MNRCPVYYNLPADCTLVAQPGECCLQPICNFNPKVNVQQSSGHAVTPDGIGKSNLLQYCAPVKCTEYNVELGFLKIYAYRLYASQFYLYFKDTGNFKLDSYRISCYGQQFLLSLGKCSLLINLQNY